jgi:hypothetical protein
MSALLEVLDAIEAAHLGPEEKFEAHMLVGIRDLVRELASGGEKPIHRVEQCGHHQLR